MRPSNCLDRRGRADALHRAQHIGERAVPTLAQRLHRDDEAHRAIARGQVQALQFALRAGGHLHLRFGNVKLVQKVRMQHIHIHRLGAVLRLQQHDGADVRALVRAGFGFFLLRFHFQQALRLHRVEHRRLPAARVLHQLDRHLDHVVGLQLLRRHMEQHVGPLRHGRGRQLQDHRRVEPLQGLEAALGLGVVRLVDDHVRLAQREPVRQRPARLADKARQHRAAGLVGGRFLGGDEGVRQFVQCPQRLCRHAAEVRLEGF